MFTKLFMQLLLTGLVSLIGASFVIVSPDFQTALDRATVKTSDIQALEALNVAMNDGTSFDKVAAAQGKTKQEALQMMKARYDELEGMDFTKEEILAELDASFQNEKANYNCSSELSKYDNLPELASHDVLKEYICNEQDDEKFYTAFLNNLQDGLSNLFKS